MKFSEIRPSSIRFESGYLGDKVRVSFPIVSNSQHMVLILGKDVAKKYGFYKGDRVILLIGNDDPFIWQIKKDKGGFKLGAQSVHLKLQIAWGKRSIPNKWKGTKFVHIELVDGNLQITLPHVVEGDLE